jgi:hypothetical protein
MSFFIASCSILNKETKLSCHPSFPFEDVCVIDDNGKLIAINDTDKLIKVQLFIDDIHNVELTYRSPFVDVVPAFSQKTILNYKAKDENFLLHYDWIWGEATPTQ